MDECRNEEIEILIPQWRRSGGTGWMNVIQPFVVQIKWIKSYLSILFTREFA